MKNSSDFSTQGSIFLYPSGLQTCRLWSWNFGASTCLSRSEKVWKYSQHVSSIACFFALRFSTSDCWFKKIILPSKKV